MSYIRQTPTIRIKMRYILEDGNHSSIRRVSDIYYGERLLSTVDNLVDVPASITFWQDVMNSLESCR